MRNRALILVLAKVAAVTMLAAAAVACGGPAYNRVPADTPALPYEAPDADEIAGVEDEDEDQAEPAEAAPAAPAEPAQNPQK